MGEPTLLMNLILFPQCWSVFILIFSRFFLPFFVLSHMILFFSLLLSMILLTLFSSHLTSSCLILYFPYLSSPLLSSPLLSSPLLSSPLLSPLFTLPLLVLSLLPILTCHSLLTISIQPVNKIILIFHSPLAPGPDQHQYFHESLAFLTFWYPGGAGQHSLGFTHASFHSSICLCQSRGYAYFICGWFDWVWWLPPSICSVYWDAAAEFPNRVLQGSIPNFYSFR